MTALLDNKLAKRKKHGHLRQLQTRTPSIDFASNDYLGLVRSPALIKRVSQECQRHKNIINCLGSTGSRLLTGNSLYAQDLEDNIAAFHGYAAGLLFNCGYMANVGLLSAIADSGDIIFFDAQVHASTRDGIRLSRAKAFPFRHNDMAHLESRLKNSSCQRSRFICIESLYSTDGSKAPLQKLCHLSREYEAHLIVDEAHAIGVWGPQGRGLVAEQGLMGHIFAQIVTFGKALGTYGAIVLGSPTLKQALVNFARSYIYTTALPFISLAAIKCSYELFPNLDNKRTHLCKLIPLFCPFSCSDTHIQPILIKGNNAIRQAARLLAQEGFDVRPLTSPTVRQGHEMLRICLHAFNTTHEVVTLLEHLKICRHLHDR
jgi:8-amino-7-oxononanoate synthase